MNILVLLQGSL